MLVFEAYMEGNRYKWEGKYHYDDRIKWDELHDPQSTATNDIDRIYIQCQDAPLGSDTHSRGGIHL